MDELCGTGYLEIKSADDRATVATILFRNGYAVRPVRNKKNGRTYEYFVKYSKLNQDDIAEGDIK